MNPTMKTLLEPRTLLLAMGAVGIAFVAWVVISAAQPKPKPWEAARTTYFSGSMSEFVLTDLPRRIPEELVEDAEGQPVYLPDIIGRGQVTVLNLWASWCAPCLEELPSLVALERDTGAKLLAIAQERRSPAQDRVLEKAGVGGDLAIYVDADLSLGRLYGGGDARLPMTIVFDRRGIEVGRLAGAADWSSPEGIRLIEGIGEGAFAD